MASATNQIAQPPFYHRQYANDIDAEKKEDLTKRITLVALPFLSLYKPLSFPLSLSLGGLRSATSFSQLLGKLQEGHLTEVSYAFFQTILSVISLAGTLFAHPLGMLITTVHDCALDCINIGHHLYMGELVNALGRYAYLVNNGLYLALFLQGGLQIAVASLAMQVFIGLSHSLSDYKKGNWLEAGGHFLMGMIRGNQLCGQMQLLEMSGQLGKPSTTGNYLHTIAYYLQKPVQMTSEFFLRAICTPIRPGIEGNWQSPTLEKVNRCATVCLSAVFAPITISLYTLGEGMHLCGNAINRTPYTYWKGCGEEKLDDQNIRCMTLNTCMLWGGLPIPLGGLRPPSERIDQLAKMIKEQDPDILFLQETSFPASVELFDKLESQYAHCLTRIGPNPMRMESGLVVFSKVPVKSAEFLPFPDQNGIKRGAFFIETPSQYFVTTHMEAGDAEDERKRQFDLITRQIEENKKEKNLDSFILGDFNIDSFHSDKEYQSTIGSNQKIYDPRREQNVGSESCTNVLVNHMRGKEVYSNLSEMVDYALFHGDPNELTLDTKLVDTYSVDNPYEAITDHKGLVLDITRKIN